MHVDVPYLVFLADVRGSASLSAGEGEQAFARLNAALDGFRGLPGVVLGPSLNYGDEVSCLFEASEPAFDLALAIRDALRPVTSFRFALVHGRIGRAAADITQVGGPAFKMADEEIERLKTTGAFCAFRIGDELENATLDALLNLADAQVARMTDYQYEVFRMTGAGRSQKDVAEALGKFPQSVSDAVKRSLADEVLAAERAVRARLRALDQARGVQ